MAKGKFSLIEYLSAQPRVFTIAMLLESCCKGENLAAVVINSFQALNRLLTVLHPRPIPERFRPAD